MTTRSFSKATGGYRYTRNGMPASMPSPNYWIATRHPWPCLLFLLPLLAVYECGVFWLGGANPELLRNGADAWLHWFLEEIGLTSLYWAPALVVAVLLGWSWVCRQDRPRDLLGVCSGMGLESVIGALVLWALSRGLGPLLDRVGISLDCESRANESLAALVTYVGAGIYEELLFRLMLFWGLIWILSLAGMPRMVAMAPATIAAALTFAAAHHLGPYGEPFEGYVFLFRSLAGFYFTLLLLFRGFGVAVGAHACYDVIVGVAIG